MKPIPYPKFRFDFFWPFEPAERTYAVVIGFSVLTIFLARFLIDGPPVAFLFLVSAALGFFFKWRKMPAFGVLLLAYFLFAPLLLPYGPPANHLFRQSHFEPMAMLLAMAVLVYLAAQYRLYGLMDRAMPSDTTTKITSMIDPHLRQVSRDLRPEVVSMCFMMAGCVAAGSIGYLLVTEFYFEPLLDNFPVRFAGRVGQEPSGLPGSVLPWVSRLALTMAGIVLVALMTRFVFWYWRLSSLNGDEAKAIVIDTAWAENHANLRRNGRWEAWAAERTPRREQR